MSKRKLEKILVVNSGSSSLKFMLFCMSTEEMLAKGLVERIGKPSASLAYQRNSEAKINLPISADNHGQALEGACRILADPEKGVIQSLTEDIMYESYLYKMPMNLAAGDRLYWLTTGAYTTSYCSVEFNGFPPLKTFYVK